MTIPFRAGYLLAEGKSPEEVAAELSIGRETLLSLLNDGELSEAFQRSIRLRQMADYGMALNRLSRQLSSENDATALKAAHEAFGLFADPGETPFRIEEEEDP